MSAFFDRLVAASTNATTVRESAATIASGIADELRARAADPVAIMVMADELDERYADLFNGIIANTQAARNPAVSGDTQVPNDLGTVTDEPALQASQSLPGEVTPVGTSIGGDDHGASQPIEKDTTHAFTGGSVLADKSESEVNPDTAYPGVGEHSDQTDPDADLNDKLKDSNGNVNDEKASQPPIDNDHVAPGATKFSDEDVAAAGGLSNDKTAKSES